MEKIGGERRGTRTRSPSVEKVEGGGNGYGGRLVRRIVAVAW